MTHYDVAVIGGGINGAGVTQAAQAAGYRTALIEKCYWAAGTSSKSSKLIHGGLRYLESAQFSLVRESLAERKLLLEIAPKLVIPLRFNIPVYTDTHRRPWKLRLGLTIYALFAGLTTLARFRSLPASEYSRLPGLERQGLQAVFSYWDAQTDDARLTAAVAASAKALGAELFCPGRVTKLNSLEEGYELYLDENPEPAISASVVVNAAGPWANEVLTCFERAPQPLAIEWEKGSHLILAQRIYDEAFYLEAGDGRAVFLLPWGEHSLLGTTEQHYNGDLEDIRVSDEERDYLLGTLRRYFPSIEPTIIDEFAGVRVLPAAHDRPFHRSREMVFHVDPLVPKVMTLYGGKLTSYRQSSEKVVRWIASQAGKRQAVADTRKLCLNTPREHI